MLQTRRPAAPAGCPVLARYDLLRASGCPARSSTTEGEVTMASGTDRAARIERVSTPDGAFDLTVWLPEAGAGPGILLIQEIFGVGDYIRAVAEDLAALGYVVAAPDLFWRLKPGHQAVHDEKGVAESLDLGSRFDTAQGVADAAAALDRLAALPEVQGGLGVLGFCLGGSIAYFLAARARLDAVVSFYGSEVPGHTDLLAQISAPIQFHFGGSDPYIPRDQVALVEAAVRDIQNAEVHVEEEAGHAFHNRKAPMFHNPGPAARAWQRTEEFLARHLPVRRL
jgi:carboxymethylenebutenolidase